MSKPAPLACVMDAIPETERAAHVALAIRLFRQLVLERRDVPSGGAFRFPAIAFDDVARFVSRERLCCPFLAFEIRLAPSEDVWLQMVGPDGTREFLAAELPGAAPSPRH